MCLLRLSPKGLQVHIVNIYVHWCQNWRPLSAVHFDNDRCHKLEPDLASPPVGSRKVDQADVFCPAAASAAVHQTWPLFGSHPAPPSMELSYLAASKVLKLSRILSFTWTTHERLKRLNIYQLMTDSFHSFITHFPFHYFKLLLIFLLGQNIRCGIKA